MAGGGIYIRWDDRLWQEQADGSYLVWNEEAHQWEPSTVQPPPQPGQVLETRECPNCGRRVKANLRYCPHCEFGFEGPPVAKPARATAETVRPKPKRDIRQVVLMGALIVTVAAGIFVFQQRRAQACDNWKAAVQRITDVTIELQGLPPNTSEQELYNLNEDLLADRKPGGC